MDRRVRSSPAVPWWARRVAGIPVWACGAMFVGVFALLTVLAESAGEDRSPDRAASATSGPPPPAVVELSPAPELSDRTPPTLPPASASTTSTSASSTTTARPTTTTTTVTTTTTRATTSTTTARATTTTVTVPRTTSTTGPDASFPQTLTVRGDDGETLTVTARRDACRGGSDCLVVAFVIDGFASRPSQFVCEFASGARFTFRFSGEEVDPACSTGDRPDSIVVEVGGLRSPAIANPS